MEQAYADNLTGRASDDEVPPWGRGDKLFRLAFKFLLSQQRGAGYYCPELARIYNQYKNLDMVEEYYAAIDRARRELQGPAYWVRH